MIGTTRYGVAAWAVVVIALVVGQTTASAQKREWWRNDAVREKLALTDEQVAELDREFRRDLQERRAVYRQLNDVEDEFDRALAEGDEARALDVIPRMVELKAAQNVARTRLLLRLSWVLTEEQRDRLTAIREASKDDR